MNKKLIIDEAHSYLKAFMELSQDMIIILSETGCIIDYNHVTEIMYCWSKNNLNLGSMDKSLPNIKIFPEKYLKLIFNQDQGKFTQTLEQDSANNYIYWSFKKIDDTPHRLLIGKKTAFQIEPEDTNFIFKQLKQIAAGIPGNFYWKSTSAQYLGCNQTLLKTLKMTSMNDIVGKTDYDLWPEQAEELKMNDELVMSEGKVVFLNETVTLNNHTMFFTVIKMPLYDLNGKIIGILGNSLDITELIETQKELKAAKEKAEAASIAKSEFIANMGHDIRTPLTGIISFSNFLEERAKNTEDKEYAKQIHQCGEQLLGLLNGVLDTIAADSMNENNILHDPFSINEVIYDVVELERPAIHTHHLSVKTHIDKKIPHLVTGDKIKLHRILLNLTGNAIKFTKIGHIELNARLLSQETDAVLVEFEVKDTGIGIPDHLQDQVFDRFFKVSPSYKGVYAGSGIGLHIAQKYVELLGGKLTLKSKEGVGTSFYFTLKMTLGTRNAPDPLTLKNSSNMDLTHNLNSTELNRLEQHSLRVLLIEDNPPALTILKKMMEPFNTQVSTAEDAESAFLLIQQQAFDLIISDVGLPKQSGDELTQQIRLFEKKEKRPACIIVGLTGHSDAKIIEQCLASGMNEVYQKPMRIETLEQIINRVEIHNAPVDSTSDLSITPQELFRIKQLPLFDADHALRLLGNEKAVHSIFQSWGEIGINPYLKAMHSAHAKKNWLAVGEMANKMADSSSFGTIQLHQILLYLEKWSPSQSEPLLEELYTNVLQVIESTKSHLDGWLNYKKTTPIEELPKNTELLFKLDQYPLLDVSKAIKNIGSDKILVEILRLLIETSIPTDLSVMKTAYLKRDWDKIQQTAHKIKSGAVYVETIRMKMACQYLERYWKSGQRELLEPLYNQIVNIIKETVDYISNWLKSL